MSLVGPNGKPLPAGALVGQPKMVISEIGSLNIGYFGEENKHAFQGIELVPGGETEAFIQICRMAQGHDIAINALCREIVSLRARVEQLEGKAPTPPPTTGGVASA